MTLAKSLSIIWLLLGLLSGNPAYACPKTDCVRIGAWNIEWFGSDNRSQPVDPQTIAGMADLIANKLSIDIISLAEINTELNGKVRGEEYSLKPWRDLQKALGTHGYQTQEGKSGYGQHIVLAWRSPVVQLQTTKDLPIPDEYHIHEYCRSSHLRKPLAGMFRADQFDFWLVGLHLKANGPDSKCTAAVRTEQSRMLAKALVPLMQKDPDIILVGDFNTSSRNKSVKPLIDKRFKALDDKERRSVASGTHSYLSVNTSKANSGSLIDHIMITDSTLHEWQARSTTIYKPKNAEEFAATFSDHVPLWADFYTQKDDD